VPDYGRCQIVKFQIREVQPILAYQEGSKLEVMLLALYTMHNDCLYAFKWQKGAAASYAVRSERKSDTIKCAL